MRNYAVNHALHLELETDPYLYSRKVSRISSILGILPVHETAKKVQVK